jgi:hypothetical protein
VVADAAAAAENAAVAATVAEPGTGVEVGTELHQEEDRPEAVGWCGLVVEEAVFVAYKGNGVEVVLAEAVGAAAAAAGYPAA